MPVFEILRRQPSETAGFRVKILNLKHFLSHFFGTPFESHGEWHHFPGNKPYIQHSMKSDLQIW
jgi:hypothetical protein